MAYMISCECINCSACLYECPVRAIRPAPSQYTIDGATCVECDGYFSMPRCQSVCPVAACQPQRQAYLHKMQALANRGAAPYVLRPSAAR